MDKENTNIDEDVIDIDTSADDDLDTESDDDYEYDENGDIVMPDVIDEAEEDEVEEDDEVVEIEQDESEEEDETEEESDSDEEDETKPVVEPDVEDKDARIAELEKKLKKLEAQGKDTLSKLGLKSTDLLEGLETLAAESEDVSVDEYRKKKTEAERNEEAQRLLLKIEFDKKAAADLAELQQAYAETKGLKSILEIENVAEFGRLRDLGLTAKQAYAAANPDGVRKQVAKAVKQQSLNESKKHLQTAVPKGSKDDSITMTKSELLQWRDLFPKLNDKEIASLYKQANKK